MILRVLISSSPFFCTFSKNREKKQRGKFIPSDKPLQAQKLYLNTPKDIQTEKKHA